MHCQTYYISLGTGMFTAFWSGIHIMSSNGRAPLKNEYGVEFSFNHAMIFDQEWILLEVVLRAVDPSACKDFDSNFTLVPIYLA